MAETFKRLGAAEPAVADTNYSLYQVPSDTEAVIAGITVVNRTTADITFRIAHVDGAYTAVSNEDYVYYDYRLAAKSTIEGILKGRCMAASDSILYRASDTEVSFVVSGLEIT